MKSASKSSRQSEDRPWLKEKVYDPKRRRTVELVKSSVDSLMKDRKRVSLAALSARSKEIDPDGRGSLKAPFSRMRRPAPTMSNIAVGKLGSGSRQRKLQTQRA